MRNIATAVLVALGILLGYALAPDHARAQANTPFLHGAQITLVLESKQQVKCTVSFHAEGFVGCTTDRSPGFDERQTWYNLRFVERITTTSR